MVLLYVIDNTTGISNIVFGFQFKQLMLSIDPDEEDDDDMPPQKKVDPNASHEPKSDGAGQ